MRVDAEDPRGGRPYFFLSYAHTPPNDSEVAGPNPWVKKLYDDLCKHILEMTSLQVGERAGFLDQEMVLGTRWTDKLSENLARCQVFVPLYSPRYFLSEQCGREWWVFSQREIYRRALRGKSHESAIVPALWVPVELAQLPQVAKDLQFHHAEFGDDYASEGFYGLTKLSYLHDQYERAVYRLAQRIVRASRAIDLEEGQVFRQYESLPTAFGDAAHPPGFDVTVIAPSRSDLPPGRTPDYYGDTPAEWNSYHPVSTRPIAEHAADLVRAMNYRVTVSDFENDADRFLSADPPTAPALLLLDRWALYTPRVTQLLAQLGRQQRPWISVMIPQYKDDTIPQDRERQLQELTDRALAKWQTVGSGHRSHSGGIRTLEAFQAELHKAVRQAVTYYEAHAKTYPPPGPSSEPPWLPRLGPPV